MQIRRKKRRNPEKHSVISEHVWFVLTPLKITPIGD